MPLEAAGSAAEAQAALRRLLTERVDEALPALRRAPKLRDYVAEYFAYYAQATDAKQLKVWIR